MSLYSDAMFFWTGQSLKNPNQFNLGPTDQDILCGQKLSLSELLNDGEK